MGLVLLSAKMYGRPLKVSLLSSGKLAITRIIAERIGLKKEAGIMFAEEEHTKELYFIISKKKNEDSFPVVVTAGYFFVSARMLFLEKHLLTQKKTVFNLERAAIYDSADCKVYKMIKVNNKKK